MLPYTSQYALKNLEIAKEVLREHAFVERGEGEISDNWIVF